MLSRKILPRAKQTFIWLITQPFHKFLTYAFATYRQYFHTKQQILYSEKKSFGGYITRLEKRYLLIDNYIYSTYEAFITSGNSTSTQRFPRYGDYIEGEMERSRSLLGSTGGWKVVSAHITTPPPDSKSPIPICRGDYNPSHITDHTSSASSIPKLDGELRASSELGGENGLAHSTCTSDPLIVPAPYYLEQFQIPAVIQSIMRQGERSVLANFPEILQDLNENNYGLKWHTLLNLEECCRNLRADDCERNRTLFRRYHLAVDKSLNYKLNLEKRLFPRFENVPPLTSVPLFELLPPFPILFSRAKYSDSQTQNSNLTGVRNISEFHSDDLCFFIKWLNQRQKRAVYRIVERTRKQVSEWLTPNPSAPRRRIALNSEAESESSRPSWPPLREWPPYVIWGPPGTGKTFTVVETVLQLINRFKECRILLCTPSNSAADLLVELLDQVVSRVEGKLPEECAIPMVRLYGVSVSTEERSDVVKKYYVKKMPWEYLFEYKIVVCTCTTAGQLLEFEQPLINRTANLFTHLFIDEASQCTEPEALIPIDVIATYNGQIVLSGDPRQLGPVVKYKCCLSDYVSNDQHAAGGLGLSLLERLLRFGPYRKQDLDLMLDLPLSCSVSEARDILKENSLYNPMLVTQLVQNYRSHPALIELSSTLFYDRQLVAMSNDPLSTHIFCLPIDAVPDSNDPFMEILVNRDIPFVFHAIKGLAQQDIDTSSWYNMDEVEQVVKYCSILQDLVDESQSPSRKGSCSGKLEILRKTLSIGIITPYRKQADILKESLIEEEIFNVKIGTCEEFQGEERLVMIVSTVRSVECAPNHPPPRKAVARNAQWRRSSGPRPSSRGPKTAHPACANVPNETDCGGDDENSDPDSGLGIAPGTLAGVQNGQQRGLPRLAEVRAHRPWSALGFLVDPRRFNVAITRARALLICVGDPMLLIQDTYWRELIRYALCKNAYRGGFQNNEEFLKLFM